MDVVRNEVSFQVEQSWYSVLVMMHISNVLLTFLKTLHVKPLNSFESVFEKTLSLSKTLSDVCPYSIPLVNAV